MIREKARNILAFLWRPRRLIWVGLILVVVLALFFIYRDFFYESGHFDKAETLQQLMHEWSALNNIPGIVLQVSKDQETIFHGARGNISLKSDEPIDPEIPFHTASTGKIFTTISVLALHEQGLLSLDEPIAPYVSEDILSELLVVEGKDYSSELTFRQLITHRSGLPNTDNSLRFRFWVLLQPQRVRTPEELIDFARKLCPVGEPDERWAYSSIGYFLLGLAIESVTGEPYHSVVRREVFEPLGMKDTYESNQELPIDFRTTHHYLSKRDLAKLHPSFEFADGGFVTTTNDLIILGNAILQERVFKDSETQKLFMSSPSFEKGFGVFWAETANGTRYLFQLGPWGGVLLAVFPENNMVIAFTLNQSNTLSGKFFSQVIDILTAQGYF